MSEHDDFDAWDNEFDKQCSIYISSDFIELAKIFDEDITNTEPQYREARGEEAIKVLDSQYSDELCLRRLTVMARRALTMERIVLNNVLGKSSEIAPVIASGTALGCTFLRIASRQLEPALGLQIINTTLLTSDHQPLAQIDTPLFIPFQDLELRKLD
ncbi:MAG: hypothetical protein WAW80_03430 [Candidatus Saccharimonadales bacterium]